MNKVFCYYSPCPNLYDEDSQRHLIDIWQKSWKKAGWQPVVLSEYDVLTHPKFKHYKKKFWSLPTEYGHDYEAACFMRWAAVAHAGGGMMTDYDVINYGFTPRDADPERMQLFCDVEPNRIYMGAVLGIQEHFQEMADIFADWTPDHHDINWGKTWHGKQHCSDLSMLIRMLVSGTRAKPPWLVKTSGCALYPHPTWTTYPMVHYGYEMKRAGYWPKADWIEKLRPL